MAGEPSRGLQDLSELVLGVDRRDQEGVARRGRKLGEAGGEGALEPGAQGKVRRPVAVPVGVAAHAWELHESQRVARRLLQDELTVGGAEVAGSLQEERTSRVVVEAEQLHLPELATLPPRDLVTAAERGHHEDRVRGDAAGNECQRLAAAVIEPLDVVDDRDHRPGLGALGEEGQGRQRDEEDLGCRAVLDADRSEEGSTLGLWQAFGPAQQGHQEPMQPGVGHAGLRLDAGGLQDGHAPCPGSRGHRVQQAGLTDAGVSVDEHGPALVFDAGQEVVELVELDGTADQGGGGGHGCGVSWRRTRAAQGVAPIESNAARASWSTGVASAERPCCWSQCPYAARSLARGHGHRS